MAHGKHNPFEDDRTAAPPVLGAEEEQEQDAGAAEEPPAPPEQVYVPSEPVTPPQGEVTIQFGRTPDDELVLLAFSSPERLATCLGEDQPWVAIPKDQVEHVRSECGADIVEWDPVRPADG